ncbi:hypothetical protein PLESTM_002054700 [Pleodorina starrii]|nr:hypothetical protein PLESTM_002054700 [Pleodorina starrii]
MSGADLITATAGSRASSQGVYTMATDAEHTSTTADMALGFSDAMTATPRLERCPSVTASASRRRALDPSRESRSLTAAATALLHKSIAAGADPASLQRSLVLLEAVCASVQQMRGSLGLPASIRASFERVFGVSPEDWFASVPEPELSSSELAALSEQKEAIAESIRAHDSQKAAPTCLPAKAAAMHRSITTLRALFHVRKSLKLQVLRESLALVSQESCDCVGVEDCTTYFSIVGAPELQPQQPVVQDRKACEDLRESLALVSGPCDFVSAEDCATFFREYGTDAALLRSSSSSSSCGSDSSSRNLGSAADESACAGPSPSPSSSSVVSPSANNTSCCAASSFQGGLSCCPASAPETAAEETEEPTALAEATAKGCRSGGLKRKLRKLLRGVFGSCVGHSVDAL